MASHLGKKKDEIVQFTYARSNLGSVLIASSVQGVCMLEFGRRGDLLHRLKTRFPDACLQEATKKLCSLSQDVVALIDTPSHNNAAIPLDIRGTDFQKRVWEELQFVPMGETLSYANLACRIARPSAVRAVARACASNSIAVGIPCHRVVLTSGHFGGYKWGVKRKLALLKRESAAIAL